MRKYGQAPSGWEYIGTVKDKKYQSLTYFHCYLPFGEWKWGVALASIHESPPILDDKLEYHILNGKRIDIPLFMSDGIEREKPNNEEKTDAIKISKTTHGDFSQHASLTQELKSCVRAYMDGSDLTAVQMEAIDMILMKVSRAVCGNPNHADHWLDIEGYARLVRESLKA